MKIKFCGATTGVTGSCHLLTSGNHQILLDCGLYQGGKEEEALNYVPFPFDPKEIEAVVLSHAHIDHCGRLPLLVKKGFTGPIYCTDATADLLEVMLLDAAHIQESDAEAQTKKNLRKGLAAAEPLYVEADALETLKLVRPILYDKLFKINESIEACFNDAGHILGSAITELWVTEGDNTSKIVFSGDLGVEDRPILRDPVKIKKADYVIMESTYGGKFHPENAMSVDELIHIVLRTVKRGGTVIIPSFAVGRTQEMIWQFNLFYEQHPEYYEQLKDVYVYIDSPMATSATEIFKGNAQVFDEETRKMILDGDNPLDFVNLVFTKNTEESQNLNENTRPKVVISASGMCDAGRIRHHLKHGLWNPKNSVVFVGYQAAGSLGRMILEGAKQVKLFGEMIDVRAEIYNLEGFSGHADHNGLLSWIKGFENKPQQLFLVHGEEQSKFDLAKAIQQETGIVPRVLLSNSEFELQTGEVLSQDEIIKDAMGLEMLEKLDEKIESVQDDVAHILASAKGSIANASPEKLKEINDILLDLEKAALNLGSEATSSK